MKKLILLLLIFFTFESFGQSPKHFIKADVKKELKLIFDEKLNDYLGSARIEVDAKDLSIANMVKTKAGYLAIYNQYYKGYLVENGRLILILKNDKSFNSLTSFLKSIPRDIKLPEINMDLDFESMITASYKEVSKVLTIHPMLVFKENKYVPITRTYFISKEYPEGKYYDFDMNNRFALSILLEKNDKDVAQSVNALAFCTLPDCVPTTGCNPDAGVGFIYPNYPTFPLNPNSIIDPFLEGTTSQTNDDVCFACCSKIRYFNSTDPLISSPTGLFDYTSNVYGKEYATVFTYWTIKEYRNEFFPPNVVINFDIDAQSTPTGSFNGTNLNFGYSFGNFGPCGADIFWVIQAMQEMSYGLYGINDSNGLYSGLKDFMAHNFILGEVPNANEICNNFGGIPQFTTDYSESCFTGEKDKDRQILSTFLTKLAGANGIGSADAVNDIVDHLLLTGSINLNAIFTATDPTDPSNFSFPYNLLINELYKAAKDINANDPLIVTPAMICEMKNFTNTYFSGCGSNTISIDEADYYIRDDYNDTGDEPSTVVKMWNSPDIWNSLSIGGPISKPVPGQPNYIHVRVWNKNGLYDGTKQLHVYYSMASLGLSWPDDWMAQFSGGLQISGEILPFQSIPLSISQGNSEILTYPWSPPDPALIGITDKHHVCIYARITNAQNEVKSNSCSQEGSSVYYNTTNFNSIAWKNLTILGDGEIGEEAATVFMLNVNSDGGTQAPEVQPNADIYELTLEIDQEPITPGIIEYGAPDPDFFKKGKLYIQMLGPLNQVMSIQSNECTGYEIVKPGLFLITDAKFRLKNFILERGKKYLLRAWFEKNKNFKPVSFELVMRNSKNQIVGGETYQVFGNTNTISTPRETKYLIDKGVVLSPNPATNEIVLKSMDKNADFMNIKVVNIDGRILKNFENVSNTKEFKIDIASMQKGIYFTEITFTNNEKSIVQFIKE